MFKADALDLILQSTSRASHKLLTLSVSFSELSLFCLATLHGVWEDPLAVTISYCSSFAFH
jgi:hypothetical protein